MLKQTHELMYKKNVTKTQDLYVTLDICFCFFHGLLVRIFQHSYLTTSEYTQIQTDLHIQTNKEKRGSCNPQYVLISIADINSLQKFYFLKNVWTMKRCKCWLVNVIWCKLRQASTNESCYKWKVLYIVFQCWMSGYVSWIG